MFCVWPVLVSGPSLLPRHSPKQQQLWPFNRDLHRMATKQHNNPFQDIGVTGNTVYTITTCKIYRALPYRHMMYIEFVILTCLVQIKVPYLKDLTGTVQFLLSRSICISRCINGKSSVTIWISNLTFLPSCPDQIVKGHGRQRMKMRSYLIGYSLFWFISAD